MTPESPVAELQPLLDALCEETISPEQLRRLEELVLSSPEAEAHYIRFMSFRANLIGLVAGLPEPQPGGKPNENAEPVPREMPLAEPSGAKAVEKPARTRRPRKMIAWVVVAGVVGALVGSQLLAWYSRTRDVRDSNAALYASRVELARLKAEDEAARQGMRQVAVDARKAEVELAKQYAEAREGARKAIEEKEFIVRLTGPTHVQPGAPNKWQIETLRNGAVGRPKKLEIVVKDGKDKELHRQTDDNPVGAATLELGAAFWTKVEPGAELFLEVNSYNGDAKSVLAERLPLGRPVYVTHLVTDKPLYKPGETVRFRSLTLDRSSLRAPEHDLHLIFHLRNPANTVTPLDEGNGRLLNDLKPVLGPDKKPLRGIGVGEFALPADAPGGEYKLDLFELNDETGKMSLMETRKFIVNRYVPDVFEKKLEFDGTRYGPGDTVQARVEVSRTAGGPMKSAKANVVASVDGKTFYEQNDARFTAVTDGGATKTVLDVRFKLPAEAFANDAPSATLSVNIQDGSDAEAIVRPIPLVTKTLRVEFFPEGGEMIAGVPGRVYFMVRTPPGKTAEQAQPSSPNGKPADIKGTITDGTNTVAEVATLTDAENPGVNRGHGIFTLTPQAGKKYFLKLTSPIGITEPTKDGWALPVAKPDGIAITALDAVTPRGAAIRVRLESPTGPKTLHVGAYVRERLVSQQKVVVEANKPVEVALKGDDGAGGVARVTVFEELKGDDANRTTLAPRAERLLFRASADNLVLHARPDKARYSPSDKVRLDLAAFTEKGAPTPAVLLVGVVNRSVITMADNKTDRLQSTHFLLSGEVKDSADLEHADFLLTDHPKAGAALDLLLGTQGWRRFAEQEAASLNPADKKDVESLLVAHGQRPSAPVQLLKLEDQRLEADFVPRMEVARLLTVAAVANWKTAPSPVSARLADANGAVAAADTHAAQAGAALRRLESRFEKLGDVVTPLAIFAMIVWGMVRLVRRAIFDTEPKSVGRRGVWLATACIVLACGSAAWLLLSQTKYAKYAAGPALEFSRKESAGPAGPPPMMAVGGIEGVVTDDPVGQPEAPNTDVTGLGVPGVVASEIIGREPRFDGRSGATKSRLNTTRSLFGATPGPMRGETRESGALRMDKDRLTSAFRAGPTPDGLYERSVGDGDAIRAFALEPTPNGVQKLRRQQENLRARTEQPVAESVPLLPLVVREYAHQRDPSLGDVRSDFTETVYWHPVLVLPDNGKATVEFQLSDDIARYQILVAGHTVDGRIGAITQTIEARKPFSVDPKMPLEISHTDVIDVPLRVTNDSDVRRSVAIKTTLGGFKTADKLQDSIELAPNGKGRKTLRLSADRLDGYLGVLVEGLSGTEKDAIARTIRVVPDGFPRVDSISDMLEKGRARGSVTLPKDVVPGTLKVRLEMYPTSMADLVKGLDGLLREPYGCFEQTSTTNYPNTLILDYLNQTNQANPEVAKKAKALLDKGYGRLTSFECPDTPTKSKQGFEWFGAADRPHEMLTAYGLLQFKDMSRVHAVDPKLIERTQNYLLSRRDGQGGFKLAGNGLHSWSTMQHLVNAYIVWALVESDPDDAERLDLKKEIAALKAAALDANSPGGKDPYFVALVANVLSLRNDREATNKLLDRLKEKHLQGGRVAGATTSATQSGGRDLEIENTSLALLGWLRANDPTYAVAIKDATKWISQQRGGYGGFGSTQSTILALKALTLYAKKSAHPPEAGELRLSVGGKVVGVRKFTEQDVEVIALDVANPEEIFKPGERVEVEVTTDAKHPYPFALAYTFNTATPASSDKCAVRIGTRLAKNEAGEGETVPLHVTFENKLNKAHGMAVAIVGIPAGMKVPTDMKQLTDLREKGQVAFFEIRGRELILYWRELAPEQKMALTVDLVCDVPGTYRGPASRGYLYYDADHKHWVEPLGVKVAPMME